MGYVLTIPARINFLGNPGDANENDFVTISSAINLHAGELVKASDHIILVSVAIEQKEGFVIQHEE